MMSAPAFLPLNGGTDGSHPIKPFHTATVLGALATTTALAPRATSSLLLNGVPTWTMQHDSLLFPNSRRNKGGTNQSTTRQAISCTCRARMFGKLGIGTGGLVLGVSGGLPAWSPPHVLGRSYIFGRQCYGHGRYIHHRHSKSDIRASGPTGAVTHYLRSRSSNNASSTALSGLDYMTVGRTATTLSAEDNATSTFAGGIQGTYLNMTGTAATSTLLVVSTLQAAVSLSTAPARAVAGAVSSVTADANNTLTISPNTGARIAAQLANPTHGQVSSNLATQHQPSSP